MNIFRTIASGKHAFREEFVSAFLAYLLSPKMDHGLGFTVLSRLLNHVAEKKQAPPLKELAAQFKSRLWENIFTTDVSFPVVELEFSYQGKGFIDIVIKVDNWFIMIENKILQSSKKENQIKEQYKGLRDVLNEPKNKEKYQIPNDFRILIIYLVPASQSEGGWSVSTSFYDEIDKVELRKNDFKALVSWQPSTYEDEDTVSIVSIIREILRDEANGSIAPINMEVKHALLSLIDFVIGEFQGFYYEKATSSKDEGKKLKVSDVLLNNADNLYVGIQYGRGGIVDGGWKNPAFLNKEVTVSEESRGWQYLPINDFITLTNWSIHPDKNSLEELHWSGSPFATKNLYRVAKYGKPKMYIGIKGGLKALQNMTSEQIRSRTVWQLNSKKKSSDWITCEDFCLALETKGISYE